MQYCSSSQMSHSVVEYTSNAYQKKEGVSALFNV